MGERLPRQTTDEGIVERYKFTKNPDSYNSWDTFNAFSKAEEATAKNPEKRGTATAILAACYMAFGSQRVDLEKMGADPLLPRLNGYLVAYNDQVDIADKMKDSNPVVYKLIMDHVESFKSKFDNYFVSTGNETEDKKRQEFKQFFDSAFSEVDRVEHEMYQVFIPERSEPKDEQTIIDMDSERERITKGRELVNAILMLVNIRACTGSDIFSEREVSKMSGGNIAELAKKYDWLIDTEYNQENLTVDEKKARMLFFSTMSNQMSLDAVDVREDESLDVWKEGTYLHRVQRMPMKEVKIFLQKKSEEYAERASENGMSMLPIIFANASASAVLRIRNAVLYQLPKSFRDIIVKIAEEKGHIREKAIAQLQDSPKDK